MDKMPVFIKIDDYKEVLDLVNLLKKKVDKAKELLVKVNDFKVEEDKLIEEWRNNLINVDEKLSSLDKRLFEPDN